MQLVQAIVDFVTIEESGDVEALRKAMYCQVTVLLIYVYIFVRFYYVYGILHISINVLVQKMHSYKYVS